MVNKLKLNVRSLLESEHGQDKALLDLCLDVVYHQDMKAIALTHLLQLYKDHPKPAEETEETEEAGA